MRSWAWRVREWCEPEAMQWEEIEVPEPAAGQVRVRNRGAAALNFFDILPDSGEVSGQAAVPVHAGS